MSYPPTEIVYFLEPKGAGEYELPEYQVAEFAGAEQWHLSELRDVTYERGKVHYLGTTKMCTIIVEHLGDQRMPHVAVSELQR